jgi:hypothetical protein
MQAVRSFGLLRPKLASLVNLALDHMAFRLADGGFECGGIASGSQAMVSQAASAFGCWTRAKGRRTP